MPPTPAARPHADTRDYPECGSCIWHEREFPFGWCCWKQMVRDVRDPGCNEHERAPEPAEAA